MNPTNTKTDIADNFHGTTVLDPYRWLEDPESPKTKQWADRQNSVTRKYFDALPARSVFKDRLTEKRNHPVCGLPEKEGDHYYFHMNSGLQNQPVFCRMKHLGDPVPEVVIDPNSLNPDGTTAITATSFSHDGKLLAYALSENGSDWCTLKIRNLETGKDLPDEIRWCKFTDITWTGDDKGFYYSRYPQPGTVAPEDEGNYNKLYLHQLGKNQQDDELIHERPGDKELSFGTTLTDDRRWLILATWKGTENKSRLYFRPADDNGEFKPLAAEGDAYYSYIGNKDNLFYLYTNSEAPNGRIIAVDLNSPDRSNWLDILPEREEVLYYPKLADDRLAVAYLKDAWHHLEIHKLDGKQEAGPSLPEMITVQGLSFDKKSRKLFISYTSFLTPLTVVRWSLDERKMDSVFTAEGGLDPGRYETVQVFYPSKDGTKVPMFLTRRKGVAAEGTNPVLLYGYGGFNISMTPSYSASNALFIEDGGIYAVANLRGGGEFGEAWHQAGTFGNKQRVFDDFISAGEWLVDNNWTQPEKLAIMGGSNGGLLVSACLNQRPDLFGAVICQVPVTDMLRYQLFTVGRFWTSEFGSVDDGEEAFKTLFAYSPLHNVREREHPATLITTADTDDRVVPAHAMKYAATLQDAQRGDKPVLLRIEKDAGHGLGKPTSKLIEEHADIYSFLYEQLGVMN
ncbi:prolyl oligopeptidase family serine peptidase [Edaphobacillus lindanitolerans]|uniref:prolyl oligopeptidase n=1 Tax=Edaphobacillus lindanitolerans TaxID=550447 RepID=A0A1U7PN16_9BACI|nr:prolyl oligopeptidase family serine peptidase [Edaphobacillus lindanitolerans]SIT71753.1 prolyl oligopeptidase [Edaphobacillus lindanitolerans]